MQKNVSWNRPHAIFFLSRKTLLRFALVVHFRLVYFIFSLFQTNNAYIFNLKKWPSSIRWWDSNPRPFNLSFLFYQKDQGSILYLYILYLTINPYQLINRKPLSWWTRRPAVMQLTSWSTVHTLFISSTCLKEEIQVMIIFK